MSRFVTNKRGELTRRYYATDVTTTVDFSSGDTTWTSVTAGIVRLNTGINEEWVSFTGLTDNGDGTYTLTGAVRGLDKDATSTSDASDSNRKTHEKGSTVQLVFHSYDINNMVQKNADETITGDINVTGQWSWGTTTIAGLELQNLTEEERDALTNKEVGDVLYNTDGDDAEYYDDSLAYEKFATGATVRFADESTEGTFEFGTTTDQQNSTIRGESDALLALQTRYLIQQSAGVIDAYKIAILNALGKFDKSLFAGGYIKFGGDGSDGDISDEPVAITGSANTYIVKNYQEFTPGNNTVSVGPTNCVVHIKVRGDADLTDTTFVFGGRGGQGGEGGETNLGSLGSVGTDGEVGEIGRGFILTGAAQGGGGGQSGSGGIIGDGASNGAPVSSLDTMQASNTILHLTGSGGAGGGGGGNNNTTGGSLTKTGGDGGAGGGCVILEIAGNLTFSSTTVDCNGDDGGDGVGGNVNWDPGGGAGGGGGGTFIALYGGTLTGSVTPDVSGGTGGNGASGGASSSYFAGGGGGGGAALQGEGVDGTAGTGTQGGDGGNGNDGLFIIEQNISFL